MTFFTEGIIYQHFQQATYLLLVIVRLQTLVIFFLCLLAFSKFQCPFYQSTFVLTFMKYFKSFWFGWGQNFLKLFDCAHFCNGIEKCQ